MGFHCLRVPFPLDNRYLTDSKPVMPAPSKQGALHFLSGSTLLPRRISVFQTSPTCNCQNDHVSLVTQIAVTLKPNPLETPELSSPLFSPGAILEGG